MHQLILLQNFLSINNQIIKNKLFVKLYTLNVERFIIGIIFCSQSYKNQLVELSLYGSRSMIIIQE